MKKDSKGNLIAALFSLGLLLAANGSEASSLVFYLDYSGAALGNRATAQGTLTVDDTLFQNSTASATPLYPGVEVTDFSLTVSHASAGNGTFGLSDYYFFTWNTVGASLDFTHELVGQATSGGGWATTHDGSTGDFNFYANSASSAPTGWTSPFEIVTANGSGDTLYLTSFRPAGGVVPTPLPPGLGLLAAGVLGVLRPGSRLRRTARA